MGFLAGLIYDGPCAFCWGWECKDSQDVPKRIRVSLRQSLPAPLKLFVFLAHRHTRLSGA